MDSDEGGSSQSQHRDVILGSDNPKKRSEIISNEFGMFGGSQRNARPWFMELFSKGVKNSDLIDLFTDANFRRDNIGKLESKGMVFEQKTEDGGTWYGLTELGKEFESGFRTLAQAAKYRAPVGRLLRGFPDETRYIPEQIPDNWDPKLSELRASWIPPFEALSMELANMPDDDWFEVKDAPTTIEWEENPESESIPRRKCQQLFSETQTIRMFSPWLVPSFPVIKSYAMADKQLQIILGPHTLNNSVDSQIWKQLIELDGTRDNNISIRGLDHALPDGLLLRLPYLMAVLEGGADSEDTVFLWGKGSKSDDYHVTMESTHPDIYEWGDELFGLVETFDCALREVDHER